MFAPRKVMIQVYIYSRVCCFLLDFICYLLVIYLYFYMTFSTDKAKMESLEQVIKPENIFPYTQRLVTIVFDFKMF